MTIRDAAMANAFVDGAVDLPQAEAQMVRDRARLLGPAYRLFYERPLHLVSGKGVWLKDAEGREYLDTYNNVASVGHCHPKVVEAITRQVAVLSTHTRYLHGAILALAEDLLATMPAEIGHVMFTCSGSEANDLAVRIAKAATGGTGIVITETAYHGLTEAVAAFSPSLGPSVPLGAHVRTVAPPVEGEAAPFTARVQAAIDDLIRHGIKPALFIADSLFTSDGVLADPPGMIAGAVAAIRAAGGLYIADEVQSGFARSGEAMWGFQRHGVVPDLVTMGKPMGNGYPVAAVAMRPEVIADFGAKARYFNTFGGNAVAAEAARAVLAVIAEEGLQENARSVGTYLRDGLRALDHDALGAIRGVGLMIGADVAGDAPAATAARIVNGLREEGVLISASGPGQNTLKIRPPLVFGRDHADIFLDRLTRVLKRL